MNKFASPVAKVNAEVIGLDVHQKVIAWCRLGRRGQRLKAEEIGGDRESFETFLREEVGRRRPHFAVKACGGFEWGTTCSWPASGRSGSTSPSRAASR